MKAFLVGLSQFTILIGAGFAFAMFGMPLLFPTKPSEVSVPATPAPEVKRAPTKRVTVKQPVKVFEDKTKFALKLPDAVVKDADAHVLAATQVKGSDRPQTVTTVIDEKTGESQTFVKTDPYPWLAFENKAEVSMAYGYKFDIRSHQTRPIGRLSFSYEALRVKALTGGVVAQVDTDGSAFAGLRVAYRW